MPKLIVLDDGHGANTPGKRTPTMPNGSVIHENQFNSPTVKKLGAALVRCGFRVEYTAPGDDDVSLSQRVKKANDLKADALISVHYNAYRSNWDESKGGVETLYQPGNSKGKLLAECIHSFVKQGTMQVDRKVKEQNLQILRRFNGPGALVECGFMDVRKEAELMLNEAFQTETAEQIAMGVCLYFGVKYVEPRKELSNMRPVDTLPKTNVMAGNKKIVGYIDDGVTYVPIREAAEALGKKVTWDAATKTTTIS